MKQYLAMSPPLRPLYEAARVRVAYMLQEHALERLNAGLR